MRVPWYSVMTSSFWRPACSAGLPGETSWISAPISSFRPSSLARSASTSAICTPSHEPPERKMMTFLVSFLSLSALSLARVAVTVVAAASSSATAPPSIQRLRFIDVPPRFDTTSVPVVALVVVPGRCPVRARVLCLQDLNPAAQRADLQHRSAAADLPFADQERPARLLQIAQDLHRELALDALPLRVVDERADGDRQRLRQRHDDVPLERLQVRIAGQLAAGEKGVDA